MAALDAPVGAETAQQLRNATVMTLMDAFDRRSDRDFFCTLLSHGLSLNETLRRVEVGASVHAAMGTEEFTAESVANAIKSLVEKAEVHRRIVADCAFRLSEMAVEGDTIN